MNEVEYIEHDGRIKSIDTAKGLITVSVIEQADCGECPASKLCNNFTPDNNLLTIPVADPGKFEVGDFVTLRGTERLHRKAILLATVIPSVALVAVMIGIYLLTGNQLAACLSALGAMIIFFAGLYIFRNKLAHEFSFEVFKQPSEPAIEAGDSNKENK